jgi:hypothetical protein
MKIRIAIPFVLLLVLALGCGDVKVTPLQSTIDKWQPKHKANSAPANAVFKLFDEDNLCDEGCVLSQYAYPEATSRVVVTDEFAHGGEESALFDLDQHDYSGGCIYIGNISLPAEPYFARGALDFWIKGASGGEKCFIVLSDEEKKENIDVEVKLSLSDYAQITTDWTHVSIPLHDFGRRGTYYDSIKDVEIPHRINWNMLYGFLLTTDKGQNASFKVWVDEVYIIKDAYDAVPEKTYWDEQEEIVSAPPVAQQPKVTAVDTIFGATFAKGVTASAEGGKTGYKLQKTTDPRAVPGVLAFYLDNTDDASATIDFGKAMDLTKLRAAKGGIAFWAKCGPGIATIHVGLLDDKNNSKDKLVQTNSSLKAFSAMDAQRRFIDTNWHYIMIPLNEFSSDGGYWDENKNAQIFDQVTWKKICQLNFNTDKFANRVADGTPAALYVCDISFIKEVPGYADPDDYWKSFSSSAPNLSLFSFDSPRDQEWDADAGEESEIFCRMVDRDPSNPDDERKDLQIEYSLGDWCTATFSLEKLSLSHEKRDWSKYRALRLSAYTEKSSDVLCVQISDDGNENFSATCKLKKGWNDVVLPFRQFKKDPTDQESAAEENGKLDLHAVKQLVFKPVIIGNEGLFKIGDVTLTNAHETK